MMTLLLLVLLGMGMAVWHRTEEGHRSPRRRAYQTCSSLLLLRLAVPPAASRTVPSLVWLYLLCPPLQHWQLVLVLVPLPWPPQVQVPRRRSWIPSGTYLQVQVPQSSPRGPAAPEMRMLAVSEAQGPATGKVLVLGRLDLLPVYRAIMGTRKRH